MFSQPDIMKKECRKGQSRLLLSQQIVMLYYAVMTNVPPQNIISVLFPKGELSLHCGSPWFEWLSFPCFIGQRFIRLYEMWPLLSGWWMVWHNAYKNQQKKKKKKPRFFPKKFWKGNTSHHHTTTHQIKATVCRVVKIQSQ